MKKIVTIGGGTGHYTLLRGLRNYDAEITSIVSVVDDGGSTGKLRSEFGILPPGDLRNCLLALSDESYIKELRDLFDYRFSNGSLSNHSLGNLILTALSDIQGDIGEAVKSASKILKITGKVLPVSIDNTHLYAETDEGERLSGESKISYPGKTAKIKKLWLKPEAFIYRKAAQEIRNTDLIVICPGELYGSIIANFLVKGVKDAIKDSNAKIVYVCNLVTKQGTYGFKASNFVNAIENYLGKKIDYVVCNTRKPTKKVVDKYKEEDSFFVEPDLDQDGRNVIKGELLNELKIEGIMTARHDPEKISKIIVGLL